MNFDMTSLFVVPINILTHIDASWWVRLDEWVGVGSRNLGRGGGRVVPKEHTLLQFHANPLFSDDSLFIVNDHVT